MNQKALNTRRENLAFFGTKKQQHKKWKNVVKELSDREITLGDIADENSPAQYTLRAIAQENHLTLGELVVLRQYAEAIHGSTKSAEFLRDTMGEKPSNDVNLTTTQSPLASLSDEELHSLLESLKADNVDDRPGD